MVLPQPARLPLSGRAGTGTLRPCIASATMLLVIAGSLTPARAQAAGQDAAGRVPVIQDNSFLIEEAYNQEPGVVQHIFTFTRLWNSRDAVASFTEEWPLPHHARHQLSFTLLGVSAGAFPGSGPGLGDVALNYRYQLVGGGEARVAFAPRFTVLLPAGQARAGRGSGGGGVQGSLPVSIALNRRWVTHWNAGATFVPAGRNEKGARAALTGYNLGQSVILLAHPRLNFMLETLWTGSESVTAPGETRRAHTLLISPGLRWAHNLPGGLQIVPGIAFPIGAGPSAGERGVFLYLSFEHPIRRSRKTG